MTHIYLEIEEQLSEEEAFTKQPRTLRIEVKDEDEAYQLYEKYKELFSDCNYVARIHYCHHDEGKPCELKIIEEHKV